MATTTTTQKTAASGEISQRAVTINAAFLREIKEVHDELWQCLSTLNQLCEATVWNFAHNRQMVDGLNSLLDLLALHFSLEEAYGYFEGPAAVEPRLSERTAALRNEHRVLFVELQTIADWAEGLFRSDHLSAAAKRLVVRFHAFHDQFREHEARENELIIEAFDDDIGVGD